MNDSGRDTPNAGTSRSYAVSTEDETAAVALPEHLASPRTNPEPGDQLGHYRILRQLGQGGMGAVYLAEDERLRRNAALKILHARDGWREDEVARLRKEARALAQLSHPHVVQVYGLEDLGGMVCVAMEHVAGVDLKAWLALRRWSERDIMNAFMQAGRGLAAAHAAGLVHRDFKPANVLVGADGRVRVADFGLARSFGDRHSFVSEAPLAPMHGAPEDVSLTLGQTAAGTPRYMAPEQHAGTGADARADQYAFCVALYEALAGQRLFESDDLAQRKLAGPTAEQLRRLPRRLRATVARGLSPQAADRFATLDDLLLRLERKPLRKWPLLLGPALAAPAFVSNAPAPCENASTSIASVWNDEARRQVEAALHRTDAAGARRHMQRLDDILTGYARRWADVAREACAGGPQDTVAHDQQALCLRERRQALAAQVQALLAEETDPAAAVHAGLSLPRVEECADPEALLRRATEEPPPPAHLAPQVDAMMQALETVRAHNRLGKFAFALGEAERLLEQAEPLAFPPLANRIRFEAASALKGLSRFGEAVAVLEELYHDAKAARQYTLTVDTAVFALFLLAQTLEDFPASDAWARHAEADLRAHGLQDVSWGRLWIAAAGSSFRQRRFPEAAQRLERGVQKLAEHLAPDDLELLDARGRLSLAWLRMGRTDEAVALQEELLATTQRLLGPEHPQVAQAMHNLGDGYARSENYVQAEAVCRRLVELRTQLLGEGHWDLFKDWMNLSVPLYYLGRYEEAASALQRALVSAPEAIAHGQAGMVVNARFSLAVTLMRLGQVEEAEAEYHRVLTETVAEDMIEQRVLVLRALAELETNRGAHPEAAHYFSRAVEEMQAHRFGTAPERAEVLLEWAQSLARTGDVAASSERIEQAITTVDAERTPSRIGVRALAARSAVLWRQAPDEARAVLRAAITMAQEHGLLDHPAVALTLADLALEQDPARAPALVEAGVETARRLPEPMASQRLAVYDAWMKRHPDVLPTTATR